MYVHLPHTVLTMSFPFVLFHNLSSKLQYEKVKWPSLHFQKNISKNLKYRLSFYCCFSFRQLPDVLSYENQNFLSTSTLGNTIYKEWASWNWEPCKGKIQFFNVFLNGKEWLRKSLQMSQKRHGGISRVDYFRKDLFFFSYPAKNNMYHCDATHYEWFSLLMDDMS